MSQGPSTQKLTASLLARVLLVEARLKKAESV